MFKRRVLRVHFITLIIYSCFTCSVLHAQQDDNYLLKPTGKYGVGYQDVSLVNTGICPDVNYKKSVNETDFSSGNNKYCHEIVLRVYYPSQAAVALSDKYYAPYLNNQIDWIIKNNKLIETDKVTLYSALKIKTYNIANAKPVNNHKFPVIIFMPGAGMSVHAYNNVVSNLASNGYIVIGVNSVFINGALQLRNGHVTLPPDSYLDEPARRDNISDLKFVLDNLAQLKYKFNLEKYCDFNKIALIGHSRGAMSIVNLLKQNPDLTQFKAVVLMDPGDMQKLANYPLPKLDVPTMTIWASSFKEAMQGSALLGANDIEVILKPQNSRTSYSQHNNFSDVSTMQYHAACQIPLVYKTIGVGDGNGYEIASALNIYILTFLDNYLKNEHDGTMECKNINGPYMVTCGQDAQEVE
jgi:dienelactone hydrolase